jgi:hypothetical protein
MATVNSPLPPPKPTHDPEPTEEQRALAASRIQAGFRGYKSRQEFKETKARLSQAATKLQASWKVLLDLALPYFNGFVEDALPIGIPSTKDHRFYNCTLHMPSHSTQPNVECMHLATQWYV